MSSGGVTVKDVAASEFIAAYGKYLKKSGKVKLPTWVDIVKTARYKELAPLDPDWFYYRIAAIARRVYLSPKGVFGLQREFGGAQRRGAKPNRFATASKSVIRAALKELEKLQVVKVDLKKGKRRITSTGTRDLDRLAGQIASTRAAAAAVVAPAK